MNNPKRLSFCFKYFFGTFLIINSFYTFGMEKKSTESLPAKVDIKIEPAAKVIIGNQMKVEPKNYTPIIFDQNKIDLSQGCLTNQKLNADIKFSVISNSVNRPSFSEKAIKQHQDSHSLAKDILDAVRAHNIIKLVSSLVDIHFAQCYYHIDNLFAQDQFINAAIEAEDRLLTIAKNPAALVSLDPLSLNRVISFTERIKRCIQACDLSYKNSFTLEEKNTLLDIWFESRADRDLHLRISRRSNRAFFKKVSEIAIENLNNANLSTLTPAQLVKTALSIKEIEYSNPTFISMLKARNNLKNLMLQKLCISMLQDQYPGIEFRHLEAIQKRFHVRGSQLFYPPANTSQMEVQKDLLNSLNKLMTIPSTSEEHDSVIHNLSSMAINLSKEGKIDQANKAIGILEGMYLITSGMLQNVKNDIAGSLKNWHYGAAIGGAGIAWHLLHPPSAIIYDLTMLGMGVAGNSKEFAAGVRESYNAAIEGRPFEFGQGIAKIGTNSYFICKSYYNIFKSAKANGTLANAIHEVEACATNAVGLQNLTQEVIRHSEYPKLAEQAIRSGLSIQAWERRVNDVCRLLRDPRQIIGKLNELGNGPRLIKSTIVPRGLNKRLRVGVDHIGRIEFDRSGNFSGFHLDCNNAIANGGKVKFTNITRADNGMYSANITINGITKPQKSSLFCNIRNTNVHALSQEVINALEQLDFSNTRFKNSKYQLLLTADNTFHVKINDFQGGSLFAKINKLTGEITTYYPGHNDLGNNINIIKD